MPRLIENIDAVAFDLDGTLVDSAPDLSAAVNTMLRQLRYAPLPEQRVREMIGGGVERLVESALHESTGRTPEAKTMGAALRVFEGLYAERLFDCGRVFPGVMEGLRALRGWKIRLCCVTNKHSRFALPLLHAAGLARFFAFTLCADRAEDKKPRPGLLLAACGRFGTAPERLLCVGDSRADIAAARAAGCPVAAVNYGYNAGRPVEEERPDWVIHSLARIVTLRTARQRAVSSA